ncbi:MAG: hypothetical protein FWF29_05115 [Treponema sp.]|nr:hypothetical protein [Treponema sp.]
MSGWMITAPILIPAVFGILILLTPKRAWAAQTALTLLGSALSLVITCILFGRNLEFKFGWAGFGMGFSLRLYNFSAFIILATAGFIFLTSMYSAVFMRGKPFPRMFNGFVLLGSAFVTGAVLADNLALLLFFWAGLLFVLFALIMTGGAGAIRTAVKAVILNGIADLCLVLGAGIAEWLSGTFTMSRISLPINTFWSSFAFVMMMIGAAAKAGAFPFHSWIPDAALDTPLPFMAFLPAALEKLLGIYLLTRVSMDMFQLRPGSALSITTMIIGSCTIIFAVMMALIQKDYKKLLAYHAVSQVGYMVLGVGTALPIGIVGGLFHMINHAMYKSCLYLTAGSVEKQAGTTDLRKLGGLGRLMPVTCITFLVAAASISGVPPFNGFFSKELIFDAALETNVVFFIVAALGAFLTAASFLKLGHTVFFGKLPDEFKLVQGAVSPLKTVKEAPWPMLAPMILLAAGCVLFGVYNPLPLRGLIEPVLGARLAHSLSGLPHNWLLAGISLAVLALAVLNHMYGVKKSGSALGAADHIHYAPGLAKIYNWAEAGLLDPYNVTMKLVKGAATGLFAVDRAIDWVVTSLTGSCAALLSRGIRTIHTGRHWMYALWVLAGAAAVALIIILP